MFYCPTVEKLQSSSGLHQEEILIKKVTKSSNVGAGLGNVKQLVSFDPESALVCIEQKWLS